MPVIAARSDGRAPRPIETLLEIQAPFEQALRRILERVFNKIDEDRSTSQFRETERIYRELSDTLDACAELGDDWNSYGAEKPSPATIKAAARFLGRLRREFFMPNRIIPSADGGIAVYFNRRDKTSYLEYRNSGEVILAMYDKHSDPEVLELTKSDGDESTAFNSIRGYLTTS